MRTNIIKKTSETLSQYIWGRNVPLQITWFNPPLTPSQSRVSRRNLLGDQLGFKHFQRWGLHRLSDHPVWLSSYDFFPSIQTVFCISICINFICKTAEDALFSTVVILSWSWPIKLGDLFSATLYEPDPQDTEPHVKVITAYSHILQKLFLTWSIQNIPPDTLFD